LVTSWIRQIKLTVKGSKFMLVVSAEAAIVATTTLKISSGTKIVALPRKARRPESALNMKEIKNFLIYFLLVTGKAYFSQAPVQLPYGSYRVKTGILPKATCVVENE
jgi:hypothetical protein